MRLPRRLILTFGACLIATGIAIAVFGLARASSLVETTGLITEAISMHGSTSVSPRFMEYRYTVAGRNYSAFAALRYSDIENKAHQLDRTISVFYKRRQPATSYAVYPPSRTPWIVVGFVFMILGTILVIRGWPCCHPTLNPAKPEPKR